MGHSSATNAGCLCMRCRYLKRSRWSSKSLLTTERVMSPNHHELPSTPPPESEQRSTNDPSKWSVRLVTPTANSTAVVEVEPASEGRPYQQSRCPHWLESPFRKNSLPSKRELAVRLEAIEAENRDMAEQLEFLQKRLRQVSRERDVVRKQLFRRSRGERMPSDKVNVPDLSER